MRRLLLSLLLSATLFGDFKEIPDQNKLKLLSPEFSQLETKKIILGNQLKAYLISDPKYQLSGAALVVNVGSWNEPVDHPGLAHFLEHMLFMGTKKYPEESEYDRYVTEHGGTSNAFTSDDITAYMFVIDHDYFEGALDRFSNFFKEPLFDPSAVSRELNAIDQEYSKNASDDDFREYYILKSLGAPDHPFSRFGMGNIESLKTSSRDDLIAWYNTHYSSDLMTLIIASPLPMDKLTALAEQEFGEIPLKPHHLDLIPPQAIPEQLQGKLLKIRPSKELQTLSVSWELPKKFIEMRDTNPQLLVQAVIGEEGPGSLLALLKEEHLAEGLSAGAITLGSDSLLFIVQIDMTNLGAQNPHLILERLFQEIALLKDKGVPEYVFQDVQQLEKVKYQLKSPRDLFSELTTLSMTITNEPLESFPEKTYVIQSYNHNDIEDLIQYLVPSKAIYTITIPNYEHPDLKKEKWLGGEYTIEPLPADLLDKLSHSPLNPQLHFPPKNKFIPTNLTVREVSSTEFPVPKAVYDTDFGQVYYAADPFYRVPKVSIEFVLHTPKISLKSPRSIVLTDYYVKAATEMLKELSYPASQAGLTFNIDRKDNTIRLGLDGFNEKAVPFMLTVIEALKGLSITQERFDQIQKEIERGYQNNNKEIPVKQAVEVLKSVVYKDYPTNAQKFAISQKILSKHFKLFTKHLFNKLYIEGMVFGNISEKETKKMAEQIISTLGSDPFPLSDQKKPEVISLSEQKDPLLIERKIPVEGNAALLAIDNGKLTPHSRAVQQILNRALSEPFFAELRTKQQTGYVVFNSAEEFEKNLFTIFAVQSTTHSARDLLARYELFLENYLQNISQGELSEERFKNIKDSFIIQLKQRPKSYTEMGDMLEKLAFEYDKDFQWIEKRIKAFEELSYEQFIKEVRATLGKSNKGRLAITVTGTQQEPNLINYRTVKNLNFLQLR